MLVAMRVHNSLVEVPACGVIGGVIGGPCAGPREARPGRLAFLRRSRITLVPGAEVPARMHVGTRSDAWCLSDAHDPPPPRPRTPARRARRTIKVALAPAWITFTGAAGSLTEVASSEQLQASRPGAVRSPAQEGSCSPWC